MREAQDLLEAKIMKLERLVKIKESKIQRLQEELSKYKGVSP